MNSPVYSGEDLEKQKNDLNQVTYISDEKQRSSVRMSRINQIAGELGNMRSGCKMSVCIPAYRESGIIENTLRNL